MGDITAAAARNAGWTQVNSARGDVEALAGLIRRTVKSGARLLHPGAQEPAGDLDQAVGDHAQVQHLAIYQALASELTSLPAFDAVMIHSPRAARELARLSVGRPPYGRLAVGISPAAVAPLSDLGFSAIHIAETPDETALLAALLTGFNAALGNPPAAV